MPAYRYSGTTVVIELSEENAATYNLVSADIASHWTTPIETVDDSHPDYRKIIIKVSKGITQKQLDIYGKVGELINLIISLNDGGLDCDLPMDEAPKFIPV